MFRLPIKSGVKPKILVLLLSSLAITMVIIAQISLRYSNKFRVATEYIESNSAIADSIGQVKGYGLIISHFVDKSEEHSYIGIQVKGSKRNSKVRVFFSRKEDTEWMIDSLSYDL